MAPEGGLGELIVFDFSFERRLRYRAIRFQAASEPLYVLWTATTASANRYRPVAGGVVYVPTSTGDPEEEEGYPIDRGENTFAIEDFTAQSGSMMVFLLPRGHTLQPRDRPPKAAKDFGGRLAVFWRLEGGVQIAVQWTLRQSCGDVHADAVALNRISLDAPHQPKPIGPQGPLVEGFVPRVFVSYAAENDEHIRRVRSFTKRLRHDGVDARIYDYNPAPQEGLSTWMRTEIEAADFVLVIGSREYKERFERRVPVGHGTGVTWEGALIQTLLREASARNVKFIPILLDSTDRAEDCLPLELRDYARYTLSFDKDYESLLRRLTNQPEVVMPPRGAIPYLPPKDDGR